MRGGDGRSRTGAAADGAKAVTAVDFAALLDAIPTPYLVMTPDLVIVDANRAYLGNVGRRREEPLGTHPAAEDEVAAGPYAGGVMMPRGDGSDSLWCRCLLGVTLLVVNDGRCQTTLQ